VFNRIALKRGAKREGESPFWISFSDLMSALMVLFLVVMAVTLISVTQSIDAATRASKERDAAIKEIMTRIDEDPKSAGVVVHIDKFRIDLGTEVRFDSGSFTINANARAFLRDYIPVLLREMDTKEGKRWMRSVVVEGFTDQDGTYLYNLQLSLDRSRSVVCALFEDTGDVTALTPEQLRKVQKLFLVGGYSFNSIKPDKAESRRVEFRIDFRGVDELKEEQAAEANDILQGKEFGRC